MSSPLLRTLLPLMLLCLLPAPVSPVSADNACTFHIGGRLFSLALLQQKQPYALKLNTNTSIYWNFCTPFLPEGCSDDDSRSAFSYIASKQAIMPVNTTTNGTDNNDTMKEGQVEPTYKYTCTRYSSNYYTSLFSATYTQANNIGTLHYTLVQQPTTNPSSRRRTVFHITCNQREGLQVIGHEINDTVLVIRGNSEYGCPVFEVSSIWRVFEDNWILIGIVLMVVGTQMLFFGRTTIETTIFIAGFLVSFAVLGAISTIFITPHSSTVVIYLGFLFLLFLSTLLAYGITRLVGVSIFFVGAVLGFIIGMLVNSLFCSLFDVYSVWSLVVFCLAFSIPFGLLTFKYQDHILIASSSLTGAYLVVRPVSWIFGGFPNQFLLYHMIETGQLTSLPWGFYLYLVLIVALTIVGAMYQLLKLNRENPNEQLEVNFIQQTIEEPIDLIKMKVDKLIERFKSDHTDNEHYRQVNELSEPVQPAPKRKSEHVEKQDYF